MKLSCDTVVVRQHKGCGEQRQAERRIPERLAAVLEEADVLLIGRLEEKSHQTFFRRFSPNRPFGFTASITSTTM
jgi:hypothetical protein